MKEATIKEPQTLDMLAQIYKNKGKKSTIIEAIVTSSAVINERVYVQQVSAERKLVISKWVKNVKVVRFTAEEWLILRGHLTGSAAAIEAARALSVSSSDRKV